MRDALRTELARRGITESTKGKGDLAIVRHVFTEDRVSVQQSTNWGYGHGAGHGGGWPYRYGTYGVWSGPPIAYTDANHYTEGMLILDAVDSRTNKLVFRGTGQAVIRGPESNTGRFAMQ